MAEGDAGVKGRPAVLKLRRGKSPPASDQVRRAPLAFHVQRLAFDFTHKIAAARVGAQRVQNKCPVKETSAQNNLGR
jgi:hypothetical protein